MPSLNIEEVFPAVGKPTLTYVERDSGLNERRLSAGLNNPGQICLLTGPSKTGKTSLYREVLPRIKRQELVIRCSGKLSASEFWASALESLDFSRLAEVSTSWGLKLGAKIGASGEAGWSWLAKAMATVGFDVSASGDYAIQREIVKSSLSAKHLIPLLKQMPIQLVVEDFHYLEQDVKTEVFQQWKAFADEGVSVLVISTTHHSVDIARANPDLTGRTRLIDVGQWSEVDLAKIPEKGFNLLGIKHSKGSTSQIAKESVGLPIITQQICQEIASAHDMTPGSIKRKANILTQDIEIAQRYVAENLYGNHKADYEQLAAGPRQRRRKHATYEMILASFALEPLKFSLPHSELIDRVNRLCSKKEPIPAASINAALRALGNFQQRKKMSLLDWHESESKLYIIEPSFLFYLRQRLDNNLAGDDFTQKLIKLFDMVQANGGKVEFKMMPMDDNEEHNLL